MWKHWWFQQSQTETCKNVVRIKVRCTVSFEEKNNLFTISWPDTKEVFFCFTFFFKVQYNQLHFLQNERGAGFFFHIMCQTGELFWWNWKKTRRVVWPTRASYCEGEIIVHVNDNEKEKVAALLNWKKINKWIKWNSKCWVWVTIIMMASNKFWHYVNTWIQV